MDSLIGQCAAIMRKRAAPRRQIVIALWPAPSHPHGDQANLAELAAVERGLYPAHREIVAVLEYRKDFEVEPVRGLVGGEKLIGTQKGRFFHDHVLAMALQDIERVFEMHARRRREDRQVDLRALGEHPMIVCEPRNIELVAVRLGLFRHQVANGDDFRAIRLDDRSTVMTRDAATPNYADINRAAHGTSVWATN